MRLSLGCGDLTGKLARLHESLYGFKHALHDVHHELFASALLDNESQQCMTDAHVFRESDPRYRRKFKMIFFCHDDHSMFEGFNSNAADSERYLDKFLKTHMLRKLVWYSGHSSVRD